MYFPTSTKASSLFEDLLKAKSKNPEEVPAQSRGRSEFHKQEVTPLVPASDAKATIKSPTLGSVGRKLRIGDPVTMQIGKDAEGNPVNKKFSTSALRSINPETGKVKVADPVFRLFVEHGIRRLGMKGKEKQKESQMLSGGVNPFSPAFTANILETASSNFRSSKKYAQGKIKTQRTSEGDNVKIKTKQSTPAKQAYTTLVGAPMLRENQYKDVKPEANVRRFLDSNKTLDLPKNFGTQVEHHVRGALRLAGTNARLYAVSRYLKENNMTSAYSKADANLTIVDKKGVSIKGNKDHLKAITQILRNPFTAPASKQYMKQMALSDFRRDRIPTKGATKVFDFATGKSGRKGQKNTFVSPETFLHSNTQTSPYVRDFDGSKAIDMPPQKNEMGEPEVKQIKGQKNYYDILTQVSQKGKQDNREVGIAQSALNVLNMKGAKRDQAFKIAMGIGQVSKKGKAGN